MLKSKTSRWLAGPYLLWMAAFIVVPLFIVVWYALTNADGRFTLDNLTQIGRYSSVFHAQFDSGCRVHGHLPGHGVSRWLFSLPPACQQAAYHAHAGHAAHVDELSAAHLCVDDSAGEERPHQQVFWPVRPRTLQHDQHLRRSGAGHGVQLPAVHDPAHLHGHDEDRQLASSRLHRTWAATSGRSCSACWFL